MPATFTRRTILGAAGMLPLAYMGSRSFMRDGVAAQDVPSILDFVPPALHDPLRRGAANADVTPYFSRALAQQDTLHVPAGTYPVTCIRIGAGKTLLTDGQATRFRQLPSARFDESILLIEGPDVTLGDCTVEGIIATFRPGGTEFNHGVQVHARRGNAPVRNIRIGNIRGRDLRGDAVSLYCELGAELDGVFIGDVFGENVLRNIVAIVGGRNINVGAIDGTACGYAAFDIEPEGSYSAPVELVRVRSVRGACCAVAADPGSYARDIEIGRLDTDPGHSRGSTPPYLNRDGALLTLGASGLILRNASDVVIGSHRARNHPMSAVEAVGDARRRYPINRSVTLRNIDYGGIGSGDSTYLALVNGAALETITIDGGSASLASDAQSLILGRDGETRCRVQNVRADGLIARHVTQCEFNNLEVDASDGRGVFQNVTNSRIARSNIRASYLAYNLADAVVEDSNIVWLPGGPYFIGGRANNVQLRRTRVNSRLLPDQVYAANLTVILR